jgi:gliding motility-associated-like protein
MRFLHALFVVFTLFVATSVTTAQNLENSNWVFGSGSGLEFQGGEPTPFESGVDLLSEYIPSVISAPNGDLLYYSDQTTAYTANHEPMPNGDFGDFALESIFVPIPGSDNYYLVRAYEGSDMRYSVIDPDLNDGLGDIVEGQKDISFYEISGRLMVASKADGSGHWLISIDNDNGSDFCYVRTFDVTDDGFVENDVYTDSWFWIGWFPVLDDAALSSDCTRLAIAFKGHYVAVFDYDNENGEVISATDEEFDNFTSFGTLTFLEFSPSGQYLYMCGDQSAIKKYDVTTLDGGVIQSTEVLAANGTPSTLRDMKRGVDGKLYILTSGNTLDRIENPDEPGTSDYTDDAVIFDGSIQNRLPNTPNLYCSNNFVAFNPETIDVCLGDSTFFALNATFPPDSVFWDFGDPDSGDENFSELFEPAHLYDTPGSYNVTVDAWLDSTLFNFELTANVFAFPEPDLGEDITACAGETVTLDAGEALAYQWNTGDQTQVINVNSSGTYEVIASNGPCAAEDEIQVTIIPFITVDIGDDFSVCDEPEATIEANTVVNWSDGSIGQTLTITEPGTYFATLENECFQAGDTIDVQFIVLPESALPGRIEACEGDSLFLMLDIENAEVEWSGNGLFSDTDSLFVSQDGVYSANYIYEGCPGERDVEVDFLPYTDPYQLVMPNVFTPNGDNVNNFFGPVFPFDAGFSACTAPALEVDMRIYNRWGNNIVEGECIWDGRADNGNEVSEGVYYYIVDLRSVCGDRDELRTINGHLTLIRDGQ